jgi:2-polyprenyl-3-methyl-5-hydroxy-6-metoxy-1,4-benzoquinol methylase
MIFLTPKADSIPQISKDTLKQLKSIVFNKHATKNKVKRTIQVDASDEIVIESYKQGAINYFERRSPESKYYEYVKPFTTIYAPPDPSIVWYLHDVANMIMALNLAGGCKILDVACANGWLSEFLFRYGYDVTGIDICEDLLQVARDRIAAIKYTPYGRDKNSIRFEKLDIERESIDAHFDAIIFYDCLHHFSDIDGVFRNVKRMLAPGGKVIIKEGAMPPKESDGEKKMLQVFEEYNTLESPFDHDDLKSYLKGIGFFYINEYIEINGFFKRNPAELAKVADRFNSPYDVNIFVCQIEKSSDDLPDINARWNADIALKSVTEINDGSERYIKLIFNIKNIGDCTWKDDINLDGGLKLGSVSLGIKMYSPMGNLIEENLGRTPLTRKVNPGDSIDMSVNYPLSDISIRGECKILVDMVLQGYFWFEHKGSKPLLITTNI